MMSVNNQKDVSSSTASNNLIEFYILPNFLFYTFLMFTHSIARKALGPSIPPGYRLQAGPPTIRGT